MSKPRVILNPEGTIVVRTVVDGAKIHGMDLTAVRVEVCHDDVEITNCRFTGPISYPMPQFPPPPVMVFDFTKETGEIDFTDGPLRAS